MIEEVAKFREGKRLAPGHTAVSGELEGKATCSPGSSYFVPELQSEELGLPGVSCRECCPGLRTARAPAAGWVSAWVSFEVEALA